MSETAADNVNQSSVPPNRALGAIILAAGQSTRMKTDLPKVLHEVCGPPMLSHVLTAFRCAGVESFYVVVGYGKDLIIKAFEQVSGIHFVEQREQKGTGHAVSMCSNQLADFDGDVVVLAGDMPLIRPDTLQTLIQSHRAAGSAASLATTTLEDPTGYGRIIRSEDGAFERIVEHRDCSAEQLAVREVNPSYYCFDARCLFDALPKVKADNAKGEYYLTDVLEIIRNAGGSVRAAISVPAEDAMGINSRVDLAVVSKLMQRRIQTAWMNQGVTIEDPDTTWIDCRAQLSPDVIIKPFSFIARHARIGRKCVLGPYAYITDGAIIEEGKIVGPGVLNAFDATLSGRKLSHAMPTRTSSVVRQPPAKIDCTQGGLS